MMTWRITCETKIKPKNVYFEKSHVDHIEKVSKANSKKNVIGSSEQLFDKEIDIHVDYEFNQSYC